MINFIKIFSVLFALNFTFALNAAFSLVNIENLDGLTPNQKNKISIINNNYKVKYNELENRISSYNEKLKNVINDKDKNQEQISMLTAAYERNISTLKNQQKILDKEVDEKYKSILTDSQYKIYQSAKLTKKEHK